MELKYCKKHNQMTNHSLYCWKCVEEKEEEIKRLEIENNGLIKTMKINLQVRDEENKHLKRRVLVSEDELATNKIIKTSQEIDYYYLRKENQKLQQQLKDIGKMIKKVGELNGNANAKYYLVMEEIKDIIKQKQTKKGE